MPGSDDCYFCKLFESDRELEGLGVYEDARMRVFHGVGDLPTYLGSFVIVLRRHTPHGLASLSDEEGQGIGTVVARLSRALYEVAGAAWTYTHCFTEGYRHVHQFVVARYPGTPSEYVRLQVMDWPGAPRGGLDEVRALSRRISDALRVG